MSKKALSFTIVLIISGLFFGCGNSKNNNENTIAGTAISIDSLVSQGNNLLQSDKLEDALKVYNSALEIDGNHIGALYGLGVVQSIICNTKEELCLQSISTLSKVIQKDSTFRNSLYNRGTCYFVLGDFKKSLSDFNSAIQLNPEDADYYFNRALVFLEVDDSENACKDFTISLKLGLTDAQELLDQYCALN